jgi:hypothetical protein
MAKDPRWRRSRAAPSLDERFRQAQIVRVELEPDEPQV